VVDPGRGVAVLDAVSGEYRWDGGPSQCVAVMKSATLQEVVDNRQKVPAGRIVRAIFGALDNAVAPVRKTIRKTALHRAELQAIAKKLQKCAPLVGCSKACCFCCLTFVKHRGKLRYRGSSDRLFPWVIPVWETDRLIYEDMLEELQHRAWMPLNELGVLKIERRHSGNDYGGCRLLLDS